MATHSSMPAWEMPRTEEPGGLQSMGSQESDMTWPLTHHLHSILSAHFLHQPGSFGRPKTMGALAVLCLASQSCLTLCDPMDCSLPGSSVCGDSSGKNSRVGCHAFLQGNFPTQELNTGLLHCRRILYQLSYQGRPALVSNVSHITHHNNIGY